MYSGTKAVATMTYFTTSFPEDKSLTFGKGPTMSTLSAHEEVVALRLLRCGDLAPISKTQVLSVSPIWSMTLTNMSLPGFLRRHLGQMWFLTRSFITFPFEVSMKRFLDGSPQPRRPHRPSGRQMATVLDVLWHGLDAWCCIDLPSLSCPPCW